MIKIRFLPKKIIFLLLKMKKKMKIKIIMSLPEITIVNPLKSKNYLKRMRMKKINLKKEIELINLICPNIS